MAAEGPLRENYWKKLFPSYKLSDTAFVLGDTARPEDGGRRSIAQVCLFSYRQADRWKERDCPSIWSLVSRGQDYHRVIRELLAAYAKAVTQAVMRDCPSLEVSPSWAVDTEEVSERKLAAQAGLGFIGRSQSFISPSLGSFLYIGVLYWEMDGQSLQLLRPYFWEGSQFISLEGGCGDCRLCQAACPSHALVGRKGYIKKECLSYLTQSKEIFSRKQADALAYRLYGCDVCQKVCPYNQRETADLTPISAFHYREEEASVDSRDFLSLSNRDLQDAYGGRSGSWRGWNVLRRNALLNLYHAYRQGRIGDKEFFHFLEGVEGAASPLLQGQARAVRLWLGEEKGRKDGDGKEQ